MSDQLKAIQAFDGCGTGCFVLYILLCIPISGVVGLIHGLLTGDIRAILFALVIFYLCYEAYKWIKKEFHAPGT